MIAAALAISLGIAALLLFVVARRRVGRGNGASDPVYSSDGSSSSSADSICADTDASGDSGGCDSGGDGGGGD